MLKKNVDYRLRLKLKWRSSRVVNIQCWVRWFESRLRWNILFTLTVAKFFLYISLPGFRALPAVSARLGHSPHPPAMPACRSARLSYSPACRVRPPGCPSTVPAAMPCCRATRRNCLPCLTATTACLLCLLTVPACRACLLYLLVTPAPCPPRARPRPS